MARNRKYKQKTVAVPDPRWERFDEAAELIGTDRSKLLNTVMAWYGHEDGVTLPRRPPAEAFTQPPSPADG